MRTRKLDIGSKNLTGQALHKIRKDKGLKIKEVVAQLQVTGLSIDESAFSKIEGSHRLITDQELFALSTIYDVSANDIYNMALNM